MMSTIHAETAAMAPSTSLMPENNPPALPPTIGFPDAPNTKIPKPRPFSLRTYCTTCNQECNTRDEYKVHMMSTAHATRVAMAPSTSDMPKKPMDCLRVRSKTLPPPIAATPIRKGEMSI